MTKQDVMPWHLPRPLSVHPHPTVDELHAAMVHVPAKRKQQYGDVVWVHRSDYTWSAHVCNPLQWLNMDKFESFRQQMIDFYKQQHLVFFFGTNDVAIVDAAHIVEFSAQHYDQKLFLSIGTSLCKNKAEVAQLNAAFDETVSEIAYPKSERQSK
eukprot:3228-Heterococcus_DN1.PRE.3